MKVYKFEPICDRRTGQPTGDKKLVLDHHCCDYCANPLPRNLADISNNILPVTYSIHETSDMMEESWYNVTPPKTPSGETIDLGSLYSTHGRFVYCDGCELRLATEWMISQKRILKSSKDGIGIIKFLKENRLGKPFENPGNQLCMAMYVARHRVVEELLKRISVKFLKLEIK